MDTAAETNGVAATAEAEIERLKEELRQEHEMYLRALADFDNFRRRVERERAAAARIGKRELVMSLLEVVDNFDRAFEHASEAPKSLSEGLKAIHRMLLALLEAQGVTRFESVGQRFNPQLHEAVGMVENSNSEPGLVIDELQRGYRWGDEVLRPARVRVAA
ncbi:MAG TPA: nucleotide exchange factor GrpE [Blastocatellia bacterium]|nr:nucleotide exchange factor GrpE [Blastocatellia bacterium]